MLALGSDRRLQEEMADIHMAEAYWKLTVCMHYLNWACAIITGEYP